MLPDIINPLGLGSNVQVDAAFGNSASSNNMNPMLSSTSIGRSMLVQRIKENRGVFEGQVEWCSNLEVEDWRETILVVNQRGVLACVKDQGSLGLMHSALSSSSTSTTSMPCSQSPTMSGQGSQLPIIRHLQRCSLRLINNSNGLFPIIEVGAYYNKVYIRTKERNSFLDILSSLLFWKSLQTTGVFNKFSVVAPIFPTGPEPTNVLVCQFSIFGPLPKNRNVTLLKEMRRPPAPENGSSSQEEGWFSAMGVLKSDGVLDLVLQNDGSLLYSIDIKRLLRSEIQALDPSILQNDNFMFIGMLPELRKQLGVSTNETIYTSKMRSGTSSRIYLQFPLRIDLEDWVVALQSFAMLEVLSLIGTDKSNELRVSNRFKITILEADLRMLQTERHKNRDMAQESAKKNVSSEGIDHTSFYATVSVWSQQLARTSIATGSYSPFWRDELEFNFSVRTDNVRIGIREITDSSGEYSDEDKLLGYIEISQEMINDSGLNKETRLPVFSAHNKSFQLGTICIKLASSLNFVLPSVNFNKFENILKDFDLHVMTNYVYDKTIVENLKLDGIATVFLDIFQAIGREDDWFQALIERELNLFDKSVLANSQNATSPTHVYNTLFRGNSVLSKSIEKYFNRIGKEYLEKSLGQIIRDIITEGGSCEMDPNRIDELDSEKRSEVLENNQARLLKWAGKIWSTIYKTSNDLPQGIKDQLTLFRKKLEIVCGDTQLKVVLNCISGFLFLRFFCPVILNPKLFHIVDEHATEQQRRVFTLLSKVLMNLSTLTMFGPKEPWMNSMNKFIETHREELLDYADKVTQRKLDFNNKVLKLSNTVARSNLEMNKELLKDLPTNPYLIERYLRETELVNAVVKYKATNAADPTIKDSESQNGTKDVPLSPITVIESRNVRIGELEFEKITENNVEVFGQDMLKYLENDELSTGRPGSKSYTTKENLDLVSQLEREAVLLFHRTRHLISMLSGYEFPSEIILGKSEYASFLVESIYYDSQRCILLDFNNMFARKDGYTKLFESEDTASTFFNAVSALDGPFCAAKNQDLAFPDDDGYDTKNSHTNLCNGPQARGKKISRWFKKIGF